MPLVKSGGKKAFKTNVRTLMHDVGKSPHVQSRKQALAIAYSTARRYGKKKAGGGGVDMSKLEILGASRGLQRHGLINSSVPGRTDKLPMNVKAGSYVLPADIPSALGQGNTAAGNAILNNMFSSGPYGMKPMRGGRGRVMRPMQTSMPRIRKRQEGGEAGDESSQPVPIIAAGGEYLIDPEVVKDLGHGDLSAGHKVLDKFVLGVRKKHIQTLKSLKPPKQ